MATNGGARPGAGRPKGSANKKTQELVAKALEEGVLPIDVMLGNMRWAWENSSNLLAGLSKAVTEKDKDGVAIFDMYREMLKMKQMAEECAKDAAPFVHNRLAAVEHSGPNGGPIDASIVIRFVESKDD